MAIPPPANINNWILWGDFLQSVLLDFKTNVWDEDDNEYKIEIIHRPTNLMRYIHQIENKGNGYDRIKDAFIKKFPMKYSGHIEPRTKGTYIFMLCDWTGNKTNVFENINRTLFEENDKLREENLSLSSLLIRQQTRMVQLAKHPEEFMREVIKMANSLRKVTAPAILNNQPIEPAGENE